VNEGYYNVATFIKGTKDGKGLVFNLDPFPVVLVRSEDSVVNFGTFEVRFYRSPGSKSSTSQSGGGRAQIRINHIANYDATRSEIASRIGKTAGSINDGAVQFLTNLVVPAKGLSENSNALLSIRNHSDSSDLHRSQIIQRFENILRPKSPPLLPSSQLQIE
jgi:hypothetical protein